MSSPPAVLTRNLVDYYKNRMLHPEAVRDVSVKNLIKKSTNEIGAPPPLPQEARKSHKGKKLYTSNPNSIDHLHADPEPPRKECTNKTFQIGTIVFEKEGEYLPNNALFGEKPRTNVNNPSLRIGSNVFDGVKDVEKPEILKHDKLFGEKVPAHRDTSSLPCYKVGTTVFDGVNEDNLSEVVLHDHLPGERSRFNINNPSFRVGSTVLDGAKDLSRSAALAEQGGHVSIRNNSTNVTPIQEKVSQKRHSHLTLKSEISDSAGSQASEPTNPTSSHKKAVSNTYKSDIFSELPPQPPKAMKLYDQRLSTPEVEKLRNPSPKEVKLVRHLVSQISLKF